MTMELFPSDKVVGIFQGISARRAGVPRRSGTALPQRLPEHPHARPVRAGPAGDAGRGGPRAHRLLLVRGQAVLRLGRGVQHPRRSREMRPIPEDLREQYLKYRVNIRVLGVLRKKGKALTFVPRTAACRTWAARSRSLGRGVAGDRRAQHRRRADRPSRFRRIHLRRGQYPNQHVQEDGCKLRQPEVLCPLSPRIACVSRRVSSSLGRASASRTSISSCFASSTKLRPRRQAGGKQRAGRHDHFDPDGEYFWPDDKGRPGLCDVPNLEDKLVVFTDRRNPSPFYQSFVAGGIKLDIRQLAPGRRDRDRVGPRTPGAAERRKLRALRKLALGSQLVRSHRRSTVTAAPLDRYVQRTPRPRRRRQEPEALAARGNMTSHRQDAARPSSQLMDMLIQALRKASSASSTSRRCAAGSRWSSRA